MYGEPVRGGVVALLLVCLVAATLAACERTTAPAATRDVHFRHVAIVPDDPGDSVAVVIAAGDIADCASVHDDETAALLDSLPGTVLTLGDNVYPTGTLSRFTQCYGPSWGRHLQRTYAALGNHEYQASADAHDFFAYFGARAPASHYSLALGRWHVVVLDGDLKFIDTAAQEQWLVSDLAAHPTRCTLAVLHQPRFSSGEHGSNVGMQRLWRILQDAGAELVLSGHDHDYERFAPQSADGQLDTAAGIRQFVVGTGGESVRPFTGVAPNSEQRVSGSYGVLVLALSPSSYRWDFVPTNGAVVDTGGASCH